jgi:hypothetical protein
MLAQSVLDGYNVRSLFIPWCGRRRELTEGMHIRIWSDWIW